MYLGEIVELAGAGELRERACHPYTEALYSAVPEMRVSAAGERGRIVLSGEPPSPMRPPSGCRFHPRCPKAFERCPKERPPLYDLGRGRLAACFLVEKEARGPSGPVAA
jgi:oligopeptide/dipeptide ABC transporter ATP-binding protein